MNKKTTNEDHDLLIVISTQVSQIKETIEKVDETLHGNGKEGLCTTVQRHSDYIANCNKQQRTQLILVGLILSAGMFIMAVLNYFKI